MKAREVERCPSCKQRLPTTLKRVRICAKCKKPILAHHKWRFVTRAGSGKTYVEHRHCDNPFEYTPPEKADEKI